MLACAFAAGLPDAVGRLLSQVEGWIARVRKRAGPSRKMDEVGSGPLLAR